ncbi:YqzK family protein [Mechercharimyces sp. CAU 1602]|uniref:YqzK family protein n=1 Tax=Mechercharimyces sp. CAU 1602 TaxID=2973933 RepID=UPI0021618DF6|nr:YqzK family protein [Mechercharimyces sp. CAU 1602]MCS1350834.1 YqzK family protein [Mechercharimyces sp. CAU 1602]
MIISLRRLGQWCKWLMWFLILCVLFFQVLHWFSEVKMPTHQYREPHGRAVKVMASYGEEGSASRHLYDIEQRWLLFYWIGE